MAGKRKVLSKTLFFQMLANRSRVSEKTVRRIYENMFTIIADELKFNKTFELPDICKIDVVQKGGVDKKMFGAYRFVEAYDSLRFKVRSRLNDYVNGRDMADAAQNKRKSKRQGLSHIRLKELPKEQRIKEFELYLDDLEKQAIADGKKFTNRVSEEQLVRLINKYTGMSLTSIRKMRESEDNIIKYQLMNKQKVGYGSLGKFGLKYVPYVEEHDKVNSWTGEEIFVEARDAYYKPQFTFLPAIKNEIRTLTEDNLV